MHNVVIIGGGAAGFFCASNLDQTQNKVLILEATNKILSKVLVSGGGRCNVTNVLEDIHAFASQYPRGHKFMSKILHSFSNKDTIEWFESKGIPLFAENDGRIFPRSNRSEDIVNTLYQEASKRSISINYKSKVISITKKDHYFTITTDRETFITRNVIIAIGGLKEDSLHHSLKELGVKFINPFPSLFTFNLPGHPIRNLKGVSIPNILLKIQNSKIKLTGPVLITHWGLSGPVVLRASAWLAEELAKLDYQFQIMINWCGDLKWEEAKNKCSEMRDLHGKKLVINHPLWGLPRALWEFLIEEANISKVQKWADLTKEHHKRLIEILTEYKLQVFGKTTFKEEFVTGGGIDLSQVQHTSMEHKSISGLYFIGEICNIDGITGGYNFQAAWSTAYLAAQAINSNQFDNETILSST